VLRECARERIVVFSACGVCGVVLLGLSEMILKKRSDEMRKVIDWDGNETDNDDYTAYIIDTDIRRRLMD
jgi:hypothetical protein